MIEDGCTLKAYMSVGVAEGPVGVMVGVAVAVTVGVEVLVGVGVGGTNVRVGVSVNVPVGAGVSVIVGVKDGGSVGKGVSVGVYDGVNVRVGNGVFDAVDVGDGVSETNTRSVGGISVAGGAKIGGSIDPAATLKMIANDSTVRPRKMIVNTLKTTFSTRMMSLSAYPHARVFTGFPMSLLVSSSHLGWVMASVWDIPLLSPEECR